jgi:arrestin-related trafficking adapter 4/5/7
MYNITLPHKAWAAGDTLTALAKFVPTSKGVKVWSIASTITETVKLSPKNVHRPDFFESTRPVAVAEHEVIGGRLVSPTSVHGSRQESSVEPSAQAEPSVCAGGDENDGQNDDLVARLYITLPSSLTPTHDMEPIRVTHRIRFSISIANLDGHTSELRCTLPVHVLHNHVLSAARAAALPTRRALFGIYNDPEDTIEDTQLPSYNAHLRDTVPATYQPYSVPPGTRTPSSGLQSPSLRPLSEIPNDPLLDRITSALLRHHLSNDNGGGEDSSPPASRLPSRLPSRASSPERGSRSSVRTTTTQSHEGRGIFRKPFSVIASSFSHSHRSRSFQSITALSQPPTPDTTEMPTGSETLDMNTARRSAPSSPRISSHSTLYRFDEVPNYETASRGFAGGGIPPLTSMRGLPTYEEARTHPLTPDPTTPPSPDA